MINDKTAVVHKDNGDTERNYFRHGPSSRTTKQRGAEALGVKTPLTAVLGSAPLSG
jgi:hypothetical protein